MEQFKQSKNLKKQAVEDMEEEIAKARREVANLAKEVHSCGSQVSAMEAKIETKKNERHNILMQAKVSIAKWRKNSKFGEGIVQDVFFRWIALPCLC